MSDENIIHNLDDETLEEFLNSNYPEIAKEIKKEGYNLEFEEFDTFYRISHEDQTAGFIALKGFEFARSHFAIMDAYVIPEYRGNNLLLNHLRKFFKYDNFEFYPRKPTKAFINVLLKNDLAFKLSPNFILSYYKFIVDVNEDIYINPKIKRFYRDPNSIFPYKANLFDMDLCSVMFRDPVLELVRYDDFFALTEARKYDLKKYKCRKRLKKVSERYIDERFETWQNKSDEILDFIERKEEDIAKELSIENLIGTEDELMDDFIQELKACNLSIDDGFKIRKHVLDKIESGELNKKSYIQRAAYLLDNFQSIDKEIEDFDEDITECPFCQSPVPDFARSCLKCGLHIREIDLEEHAANQLNDSMDKIMNGLMNNFSFEFEDVAPIEETDSEEMKDLKRFFNEHMVEYDFEEFLQFYNSCNEEMGLEEIKDIFIEDKLNKSLGSENEFDTYFKYLLHYIFYYQSVERYDDAFVKTIQIAILASNKAKNKKNILESSPHSIDVFFAIDEMENSNHSFDLSKSFNEAVDTFKIEKYNKNHDEVLKELKEIFN